MKKTNRSHISLKNKNLYIQFMSYKYQIIKTEERTNQDTIMEFILTETAKVPELEARIQELENILENKK